MNSKVTCKCMLATITSHTHSQAADKASYPVDSEEQTLQVCKLGGGEAEKTRRVVWHGASSALVPGQSIWKSKQSIPQSASHMETNAAREGGAHRRQ